MGQNKDKKPNIDSAVKGLSPGFNTDVYSKLDRLLFNKESEFYAAVSDKYIKTAISSFLDDQKFRKVDSNGEYIFISAEEGSYRFTDEVPSGKATENILDLPIDWDTLKLKITSYLEDNPLDVEEDIQEALTGDEVAKIQEELGIEIETRIYLIDDDDNRYYKGYANVKGMEILVTAYDNEIVYDCEDISNETDKEKFLSRLTEETVGDMFDKPMGRDNRTQLKIYNSSTDGLLKTDLEKEIESLKPELDEKGFATLGDGRTVITDKEKMKDYLKEKKEEDDKKKENEIDADYLESWMMDNGEDVVADGPYNLGEHYDTLGENVIARLEKEFKTKMDITGYDPGEWYETIWNTVHDKNLDSDKTMRITLEEMADIINKEDIKPMW
ncbi:MAG: hypothetical protein SLAVMIC_00229 [uncultured marine phage]|uniref:Uncharacterized protein n=1 Tax=uncultured marine phage TaxID=707152 RepID=A0A8D9C9M6_9VIRU|nr:MAG: hypothetical protein SLAVMIC_00229 [uncultured marine phage]